KGGCSDSTAKHRYTDTEKSLDIPPRYTYRLGMYLRTTKRHNKDGSIVEYYQLAETRWDPVQRRPGAHIIYNFGRADTLDREALLRLAQSISRVCQEGIDVPPEVSPPGEAIDIEWARPLGLVHVARALWEELGIGEVLRGLEPRGPRRAPHELALFTMVANRLAEPLSKLACYEYWRPDRPCLPEAPTPTSSRRSPDTPCCAHWFSSTPIPKPLSGSSSFPLPIFSGPVGPSSSGIRPVCTLRSMTKTPSVRPSVTRRPRRCASGATTKKGAGISHRWWWAWR